MGYNIMKTYTCKVCGNSAEVADEAKFCQQCGARLEEDVQSSPPSVVMAPQMRVADNPRNVVGPLIKDHLLAQLVEGGVKKSGRFEVRRDGVLFITSSRWSNKLVQVHVEDIASVGFGAKDNILAIHRKSGGDMLIKMGNVQKWATMIRQQMT